MLFYILKKIKKNKADKELQKDIAKSIEKEKIYYNNRKAEFKEELESIPNHEIKQTDTKYKRGLVSEAEFNVSNVTKSTSIKRLQTFIAIDVETTGIKVSGTDIIEISAIKFVNFAPAEIFTTLVSPRKHIPEDATAVNGITDEMVKDSPKFTQIIDSLSEFIGKYPIVAHNATFDARHIYANGFTEIADRKIYDTLSLSRKIFSKDEESENYISNNKLQTVCNEYGIYFDDAHRSSADALACGKLFVKMLIDIKGLIDIDDLLCSLVQKK